MTTKAPRLTVREWIESTGILEVSALLKADSSSVRNWRRGFVLPKPHQMEKIRKVSKGTVCLNLTFEDHFSAKNKARWKSDESK